MFKVMLRDNMAGVAKEILEAAGDIEVTVDNDKATNDPAELAKVIEGFDGLGVRSGTKVDARVLEAGSRLKVIGRAGIGVDNIEVAEATRRGVVVMNAPGGNTVTTAEHAISLLCSLARHVPQATASLREGKWEKKRFLGVELTGKTLGVIGLGQIGQVVASRAKGLKMNVMAADPYVTEEKAKSLGVELVSLDRLYAKSDFITLHVPRMEETKNMINAQSLKKMKDGVRIVNCSRGEVVNLDDLLAALESNKVAGAALDVFPKEPPDPGLAILKHPKVIMTPHLGASTGEAQEKVARMIAQQMADYLINGVITNAVNFPSISPEAMDQIRPYLDLAERMGAMMGQLTEHVHAAAVTYSGEITAFDTRPVTHAILKGLLGSYTDQPVNYVSAPSLAQSKGIKVEETISRDTHDYTTLIKLTITGHEDKKSDVWGTIFGKKNPRIVRLDGVYMDGIPEGSVLVIRNWDKPGVIGNIGTTLAARDVNIGRFQLGRREGQALCMVNIDSPADETVIKELAGLPNIISVRQLNLD